MKQSYKYKSGSLPSNTLIFVVPFTSSPHAVQWINLGTLAEGHGWYDGDFGEIPSTTQIRLRLHSSGTANNWCLVAWGY